MSGAARFSVPEHVLRFPWEIWMSNPFLLSVHLRQLCGHGLQAAYLSGVLVFFPTGEVTGFKEVSSQWQLRCLAAGLSRGELGSPDFVFCVDGWIRYSVIPFGAHTHLQPVVIWRQMSPMDSCIPQRVVLYGKIVEPPGCRALLGEGTHWGRFYVFTLSFLSVDLKFCSYHCAFSSCPCSFSAVLDYTPLEL